MSLQSLITFCTIYNDVNAYPFLFIKVLCSAGMSFRLLMSVAMLLQCALIIC